MDKYALLLLFLLFLVFLYCINIFSIYFFNPKKGRLISKNHKNKIHIYNIFEDTSFYIYIIICLLYLLISFFIYIFKNINNIKIDPKYIFNLIDNLLAPIYIWIFYIFIYILFIIVHWIFSLWIVVIIPYTFNTVFVYLFLLYFVYNIFNINYASYILLFVILYESSKFILTSICNYKEYNYFDILFSDMIHILYYLLIFLFIFTILLFLFNIKLKHEFAAIFIFLTIIYTIIINNPKIEESNELIIIIQNIADFPHFLNVKNITSYYSSKKNDFLSLIIRFFFFILKLLITFIGPIFIFIIFYFYYGTIYKILNSIRNLLEIY